MGLALFLIGLVMIPINGFILALLWGWFLVDPLGVPDIGVADALGISLLISMATYRYTKYDEDNAAEMMGAQIIMPFFFLALGFVYHIFQ